MRILVYGAGAMGLYFSARLAQAGHDVVLKARTASEGARIEFTGSDQGSVSGIRVLAELASPLEVDAVLIATKAWQVEAALKDLWSKIDEKTVLVTLQNGIDAPEVARRIFPRNPVIATTCVVIVKRTAPLTFELVGGEATLTAGLLDSVGAEEGIDKQVVQALNDSSVTAILADDVLRALWKKLALIASYGGIGAVSGLPVGVTRTHPETRAMVFDGIAECAAVARASGVAFSVNDIDEVFSIYTDVFDPSTTSSMQRDLAAGLPSELEDQNGAIVARAERVGIAVPTHTYILRSQLPRERQARTNR